MIRGFCSREMLLPHLYIGSLHIRCLLHFKTKRCLLANKNSTNYLTTVLVNLGFNDNKRRFECNIGL